MSKNKLFYYSGITGFLFFYGYISIMIGFSNLIPLYPLDGGRIAQEIGIAAKIRGNRIKPFIRILLMTSTLIVFIGLILLPLVIDLVLLIFHSIFN